MGRGAVLLGGILLALCPPAAAQCDAATRAAADGQKALDAWTSRHKADCPVCSGGFTCREAFERQESARKKLEDWKKGHACPACSARCTAADLTAGAWTIEAQQRHRKECRRCEGDRCAGLKAALDDVRRRVEAWKREHPALCDKCAPACDDWKRRAHAADQRHDDQLAKHKSQCGDCRTGGSCERPAILRHDRDRERQALWKKHAEACACAAPSSVRRR